MKIAFVHDWLVKMRGGEKVLEALSEVYPHAPIYTLIYDKKNLSPLLQRKEIIGSWLQKLPWGKKYFRLLLPLFPSLIEGFDLSSYEVIISTSHCVAKGVVTIPHQIHICYLHAPMRYIWDFYFVYRKMGQRIPSLLANYLRIWDFVSSQRVDYFICNSQNTAQKIKKYWGREASMVIYPPVDTKFFTPQGEKEEFYLVVSELVPYKRVDVAVEAFNDLGERLKIVGDGPMKGKLKKIALRNVEFLGWVSPEELRDYYSRARALIFPGEEDAGIVPLEAQSCGTPVIAYGKGGVRETLREGKGGVFFFSQDKKSLLRAIKKFETMQWDRNKIRKEVLRFSKEKFQEKMKKFVEEKLKK